MSLAALPPTAPSADTGLRRLGAGRCADLEQYAQTVSHELRSPIAVVLGFARMLREQHGAGLGTEALQCVGRIEQAARTLEALTSNLLELALVGNRPAQRTRVDPLRVLAVVRAELEPRLEERGIELALPDAVPHVWCEWTQLQQVFANLLGNAVDYMGPVPRPRITVDIEETPSAHQITVTDNGRGIDAAHHPLIFEAFQSFGLRHDGRRGTGIGLAIVHRIAEAHGGRVWVESGPGAGCAFHVLLPRA